jgi:glycosyltransferase involved in cell wall biosynthesis
LKIGGLEVMALNLAIAHHKAGHFSAIYTIFEPGELAGQAREAGVPVIPFFKKKGFSDDTIFAMAKQLRGDHAQVVHTHNSVIHHYGVLAGKLAGVDAIVNTRHGLAFHSGRRQETYFRAVIPFTAKVIFVCQDGRRHYVENRVVPEKKSCIVLNGIPVETFQARRARPGASRPRIRFGTIGRMVKAKAHTDLVEAFALLAARLPEAELEMWGDGELYPAVRERVSALGLEDRVHLKGATLTPAEALAGLDVFVLSSISEGLPLVILEAMAAGLPIVSTRVGGVPEVAPETEVAWYSPPGNPAALAEAMFRAASADLGSMGEKAYRLAAERFSLEAMQSQYEELFSGLVRDC